MVFLLNANAQQAKNINVGYVENYSNLPRIKFES